MTSCNELGGNLTKDGLCDLTLTQIKAHKCDPWATITIKTDADPMIPRDGVLVLKCGNDLKLVREWLSPRAAENLAPSMQGMSKESLFPDWKLVIHTAGAGKKSRWSY